MDRVILGRLWNCPWGCKELDMTDQPTLWTFFGIAILSDWDENFLSPVAFVESSKFAGILSEAL